MNSKKIVNKILTEGAEFKFRDKSSVIVVEADLSKEEAREYAAEIFKELREVKCLKGKVYTITLEIEVTKEPENPEAPKSSENPEGSEESGVEKTAEV